MSSESPAAAHPLRLRKLVIRKCRNIRPTTLEFDDEWNILLGKNGAGKTTLLRLLRTLFAVTPDAQDVLDHDVEVTFGRADLEVVARSFREPTTASVGLARPSTHIRVELVVRQNGQELGRASRTENQLRFESRGKSTAGLAFDSANIAALAAHFSLDMLAAQPFIDRFDEALASFAELSEHAQIEANSFTIASGQRWAPASFADRPKTGAATLANSAIANGTLPDRIELTRANSIPLDRASSLMGFEGARFEYTLHSREEKSVVYRVSRLEFHGRHDSITPHEHLSFGQKRLVAFLFYLEAHPEILLADELTNGLHYDWIVQLVGWMSDRQKFLAAQNPLMIDRIGFMSVASVQRRFIRCEREDDELVFRHFTEAEAEELFATYQAGAQLVSELLREQGLW